MIAVMSLETRLSPRELIALPANLFEAFHEAWLEQRRADSQASDRQRLQSRLPQASLR